MNLMNSTPTVSRFPDKTWVHADDASGLYAISRRKSTGWCDITVANIRTLRNLKSGWDSYGARSVDLDSRPMLFWQAFWLSIPEISAHPPDY